MIKCEVVGGTDSGRAFDFDQVSISMGRSPECDLVLGDPGVSRHHATIKYVRGGFLLENHSSNGTLINGNDVSSERIKSGDLIEMGDACQVRVTMPKDRDTNQAVTTSKTPPAGTDRKGSPEPDDTADQVPFYKKPIFQAIGAAYLLGMLVLVAVVSLVKDEPDPPLLRDVSYDSRRVLFGLLGDLPSVPMDAATANDYEEEALKYCAIATDMATPESVRPRRLEEIPRAYMRSIECMRLALAYRGYRCNDVDAIDKLLGTGSPVSYNLIQSFRAVSHALDDPISRACERAAILGNGGRYERALPLYTMVYELVREVDCPMRRELRDRIERMKGLLDDQDN